MVSEKEHLRLPGQFSQHLEASSSPVIIEVDKQIIRHKRQGICMAEIIFYGSNP